MKKIFILAVTALFMASCSNDVEFNTPALQGDKDGDMWKADFYNASVNSDGQLVINGGKGQEEVFLTISSTSVGTYTLGDGSANKAQFFNPQELEFSTNNNPDPSIQVYPAGGEIIINEYNASSNKITGTFWFNAFSETGLNGVNFSQGVFYRIPIRGGGTTVVSCDDAVSNTQAAEDTYNSTDPASAEFATACNAYRAALIQQITSCGDGNNVLQDIIDGLNCGTITTPGDCQTCTLAGIPIDTEYCDNGDGTITVTIAGNSTQADLGGLSFAEYIAEQENLGFTCD
ncbi:MAG: DUF6252 family protein [Oceanihabitans sp.]